MLQGLGQDSNVSTDLAFGDASAIANCMRSLRRFPALLWLAVYVGSVFVLMGSHKAQLLAIGAATMLIALACALFLALRREPGRPRPARFVPVLGGVVAFYVIAAAVAAPLGAKYAIAAVLAAVIPTTAVAIVVATARTKSVESDGRLHDTAAEDEGPFPGIGLDHSTPLGDTPEVHGVSPHDLPKGHPGRKAAERQADGSATAGRRP
jgi:hypothetical protein